MDLLQLHEFHFVIARSLKKRIESLDIFKGVWGFSKKIVRILSLLSPVVRREHKWGEQRMSRYKYVSGDPDEIREDVHAYLPAGLYRELKLLHQDLNFYSIAQLLRGFLEVFFGLVDVYGDDVLQELERMYKQWEEEAGKTRLTLRQYLRQLLTIIQHIPGKNRVLTVYDGHFSPFWILRL